MGTKGSIFNSLTGKFENIDHVKIRHMETGQNRIEILREVILKNSPNRVPKSGMPIIMPNMNDFFKKNDGTWGLWLGHSSVVFNWQGKVIVFDPVFNSAAPVPWLVKRFYPAPIDESKIGSPHFLVISHDHYDHFDSKVLKNIEIQGTQILVPLGLKKRLRKLGMPEHQVIEFDWWDKRTLGEFHFTFTPTQHFSGRTLWDRDKTLWGSWCIKSNNQSIFFSGDSGYNQHFSDIGQQEGPFDLAMIETGQYNPLWTAVHMLPEESVQAALDLRAKSMMPIHWGAYTLSTHAWNDPPQRANKAGLAAGLHMMIPKIGEVFQVNQNYKTIEWWDI